MIQRFVQEIGRAKIQGPKFGFLIHIGGEDNDWKKNFGPIARERFQNGKAIHMGHEEIEQDQVRIEFAAKLDHLAGIGR